MTPVSLAVVLLIGQTAALLKPTCGMCVAQSWHHGEAGGYGTERSRRSLEQVAALGVTAISLTPFSWSDSLASVEVTVPRAWSFEKTRVRLARETEAARSLGMQVMVKPHIWVGAADWRGNIQPAPERGGWDAGCGDTETSLPLTCEPSNARSPEHCTP